MTNEATTTWKNFYEEHNKSLENSGNDSVANAPRQMSIGHIGKRIFDQQFQEVEIVDIGGTLRSKTPAQDFHTSLNNLNITQQLASLECPTNDFKLTAPVQNFELSSFTNQQSKVFGDDISIPVMPEMTNPIVMNFSIQPQKDTCDDLDEIVKDLERSQQANMMCPGPFKGDNISEYIEVDLNMTHVAVKNDDCEMSITDTILNPAVEEVSKSISVHNNDKKLDENDWIVDKENIAINPYITPKESKNFALNESSDKVLVFDGKKLTVKSEKATLPNMDKKGDFRCTLQPDHLTGTTAPKRKTIVLNTNDDLPNFMSDSAIIGNQIDSSKEQFKQSIIYNESDLSITQAVSNQVDIPKRKTIVFEDGMGNISITQAVPAKVIVNKQEKRKTIIYESDSANISVTQAVPTNIIGSCKSTAEKRKTVVYENDISFTQALPANLILTNKEPHDTTNYYQEDSNISVTQVIPENIIDAVRNKSNINISNISITQAVPTNIIDAEIKPSDSREHLIYGTNENLDIEITQAVSNNVLLSTKTSSEKRKTIVFEQNAGDISVTQAIPANILENIEIKCNVEHKILDDKENIPSSKTSAQSVAKAKLNKDNQNEDIDETSNRRKTILYNEDAGDISMTQAMPTNIMLSNVTKMETSSDHDLADISMTRVLPTNILLKKSENDHKEELNTQNLSNMHENAKNILTYLNSSENKDVLIQLIEENKSKRSMIHDNSAYNLSITKPIPSNILDIQTDVVNETEISTKREVGLNKEREDLFKDNLSINQGILVYQTTTEKSFSQSEFENCDRNSLSQKAETSVKESLESKENYAFAKITPSEKSINSYKTNEIYAEKKQSVENLSTISSIGVSQSITKCCDEKLKVKKSFLNELLDMSNASLKIAEKPSVTTTESGIVMDKSTNEDITSNNYGKSNESFFSIINDDGDCVKEDNIEENINLNQPEKSLVTEPYEENTLNESSQKTLSGEPKLMENNQTPALEYIDEPENVQDLQNKNAELKAFNQSKRNSTNRHYERVVSADMENDKYEASLHESPNKSTRRIEKSFKHADNTRELLGMLSDFTEGETDELETDKSMAPKEIETNDLQIENKIDTKRFSLETKENIAIVPKRLSFVPKRRSIVLSREDLLLNLSMAQAALQQSRFEIDENESLEETQDPTETTVDDDKTRRKSVRISNEVVKTLHFDEESISEETLQAEVKMTPLKKTAFGETTYMREDKSKVIPTYLKDVSDNLKALMTDLVKPMADVTPFETVGLNKSASTCSTQIQANLITSSQIDINVELHSNAESIEDVKKFEAIRSASIEEIEEKREKSVQNQVNCSSTRTFESASTVAMDVDHSPILQNRKCPIPQTLEPAVKSPVIVFDHANPLNNVLLAPIDGVKVHKYNPIKSTETMHSEHDNFTQMSPDEKVGVERLSTHYNVVCQPQGPQSGDNCNEILKDSISLASNISKPVSIDRSTEGFLTDVKSTEVNTFIAMKENKELLEASSSLTLVDDTLARSVFDVKLENKSSKDTNGQKSPLRVIYNMETDGELIEKVDSDVMSVSEAEDNDNNARKRSYSPTRHSNIEKLNADITPKPVNKMQKMSNSPQVNLQIEQDNEVEYIPNEEENKTITIEEKLKSPQKKSPKKKKIIVQRADIQSRDDLERIDRQELESIDKDFVEIVNSMEVVNSSTSSKQAQDVSSVQSVNWSSKLSTNPSSNLSTNPSSMKHETELDSKSSQNLSECSSGVNVVDRINMLKIMG